MKSHEHTLRIADSFAALEADRSSFQGVFVSLLERHRPNPGRLLDVGCGEAAPVHLRDYFARAECHDGLDPTDAVDRHPDLHRRFRGELEASDVPDDEYDTALSYNVLEHVATPEAFMQRIGRLLRSGGEFWALTPHGRHPFTKAVRLVQWMKLKQNYKAYHDGANDYPAWYRLNTPGQVMAAAAGAGFDEADFWYLPCANWDTYFPGPLRRLPHLYDRMLGRSRGRSMLLLACRLRKAPAAGEPG